MAAQPDWRDAFVLEKTQRELGERGELRLRVASGELSANVPLVFSRHSAAVL